MYATAGFLGRVHIEFVPPAPEFDAVRAASIGCSTKQELTDDWLEGHDAASSAGAAELERYASLIWQCPDFAPMMHYLTAGELPADDDHARKIVLSSTTLFQMAHYITFTRRERKMLSERTQL